MSVQAGADRALLKDLQSRVSQPESALRWIFDESSHERAFLKHVKDGDSGWLKMWPVVRKVAGGEEADLLDDAMSQLLLHRPKLVFTTIRAAWPKTVEGTKVTSRICALTGLEQDGEVYLQMNDEKAKVLSSVGARLKAVLNVSGSRIRRLKTACVEKLRASEALWKKR